MYAAYGRIHSYTSNAQFFYLLFPTQAQAHACAMHYSRIGYIAYVCAHNPAPVPCP